MDTLGWVGAWIGVKKWLTFQTTCVRESFDELRRISSIALDCSQPLSFLDANREREARASTRGWGAGEPPHPHARASRSVPVRSQLQRSEKNSLNSVNLVYSCSLLLTSYKLNTFFFHFSSVSLIYTNA